MSEEEKKEYIEHEILDRLYCLNENDFDKDKVDESYIKAVLKAGIEAKELIERQEKEIEELQIIADDIKGHNIVYTDTPEFEEKFISKNKIKEKIKELEIEIERKSLYEENWNKIEVLKELLEE